MYVLIGIALKSLLIAGMTLGLLTLMKRRSAAERSWVAHIGLLSLVIMAFAPLVLPSWSIETPALSSQSSTVAAEAQTLPPTASTLTPTLAANRVRAANPATAAKLSPVAAATAAYAVPATILLFITLLALGRLIALRARAEVLVDGHWLSALARAQRRMGFKHGTALLTSDELASPISWGLMRPVILLNNRAVEASGEAEAIIAHELAHVARMDWAKLLLARVATALFWFNPLVWILAREAHQLREEAADDAVLAADIVDTDYAQLLVGVARHECPGLLLGAHGVAPSKSSLARRIARVLDGTSIRGPAARSFALGVFTGAVLIAAPLAALTLTPAGTGKKEPSPGTLAAKSQSSVSEPYYAGADAPTDLASIIADGVSTSVDTAVAAVAPSDPVIDPEEIAEVRADAVREAHAAVSEARAEARSAYHNDRRAITMKAAGVTPEYIAAMRAAAPRLRNLDAEDFASLRAVGVTPKCARDFVAAGFPSITEDELVEATAIGLTGGYIRAMRAAGVKGTLDDFIELRAVGVDPEFAARVRKSGVKITGVDDLVELRALSGARLPAPPKPPSPPGRGGPPPPDWDPPDPDDG